MSFRSRSRRLVRRWVLRVKLSSSSGSVPFFAGPFGVFRKLRGLRSRYGGRLAQVRTVFRTVSHVLARRPAPACGVSNSILEQAFTFCQQRSTGPNQQIRNQATDGIRPLYDILQSAGVQTREINQWPPEEVSLATHRIA